MGYRFLWGFRFPLPTRSSVVTPAELLVPPETSMLQGDFPATAPAANPVFYRTYSRKTATGRESWKQVVERNLAGLKSLGQLNDEEIDPKTLKFVSDRLRSLLRTPNWMMP